MRTTFTIKGKDLINDETGDKIPIEDILVHIDRLNSISKLDYLLQIIYQYHGMPNKISIAKKLNKYKNEKSTQTNF